MSLPFTIVHDFDKKTDFYFFGGESSFLSDYFVDYSMISFGTLIKHNLFYLNIELSLIFLASIYYISKFFSLKKDYAFIISADFINERLYGFLNYMYSGLLDED